MLPLAPPNLFNQTLENAVKLCIIGEEIPELHAVAIYDSAECYSIEF